MKKITESSTLMTLFSLSSKSVSFVIITPFLLSHFSPAQIAFWYLLGIFINMQTLADFGFYNTFVRTIALSLSGGVNTIEDLKRIESKDRLISEPNVELCGQIIGTMRHVYLYLSICLFIIMLALSPFFVKNINELNSTFEGWACWIIVVLFSVINFCGRPYSNFLMAQNKVALVRKWEGVFNSIAILVNILVILFVNSLLLLVISNQIWVLVNVLRNRYLAFNSKDIYKYKLFLCYGYDKEVMRYVWPLAWRAGLSSLTTTGVVGFSGLVYAQISTSAHASSYLFAEKLYNALKTFAMAPFYSKIPLLVSYRGQNRIKEWEQTAQKGMLYTSLLFVVGVIGCDMFGEMVFKLFKSNISFPNHLLWLMLGWSYFLHRYGAMHTQLYTTINKVNSHISDLLSGVIMIIVWILFINQYDVYVFPLGMLCGYLGFYIWFATYYSYRVIQCSLWQFELRANILPFGMLLVYSLIILALSLF